MVTIDSAWNSSGEQNVGFCLSQTSIYRGVAKDGSVLMRERERSRSFGAWRYARWPEEYQDKGGKVVACIPATSVNDAAMDEFRNRIRELQKRLSHLIKPATIHQTLANLSGIGLPAPNSSAD